MIRKMCGVKLVDGLHLRELIERLGLKDTIVGYAWQGNLRWLDHVLRKNDNDFVKQVRSFELQDS